MIYKPTIESFKNFVPLKKRTETKEIVVHCSATQCLPRYGRREIEQMHRQRGFATIGYHYVIKKDGTIQEGRPMDTVGAHAVGHNSSSISICLIGGVDSHNKPVFNYSEEQMSSLKALVDWLRSVYINAPVQGHRDYEGVAKECPCFDVRSWYERNNPAEYIVADGMTNPRKLSKLSNIDFEKANEGQEKFNAGDIVRIA